MSDYNRINSRELDNFITGHYGEDQFRDYDPGYEKYDPPDEEECTCGHMAHRHEQSFEAEGLPAFPCPCTVEGCGCQNYWDATQTLDERPRIG